MDGRRDDYTAEFDRRALCAAVAVTLLLHVAMGVVAVQSAAQDAVTIRSGVVEPETPILPLCDGRRCPALPWPRDRMGLEDPPPPELDIIEAAIIPRLGLAEEDPNRLPEIQAYEQPEVIEEAVNIAVDPPPEDRPPPLQAPKPSPAKRDRRRPKPPDLASILAPQDDDPRARATSLDRIIGREDGDAFGHGRDWGPGNEWAGQVTVAMRKQFQVPSSISDAALRRLSVQILIQRMTARGEIVRYEIQRRSGNTAYDTAALQLIKTFMPSEGGTETLPEPPAQVLDFVNQRGLLVELEGRLFRR